MENARMKRTDPFRNANNLSDLSMILTPRERETLYRVVEGCKNSEIASRMGITVKTVEKHRKNMMEKLRVRNLQELFRMALKYGLLNPDTVRTDTLPGKITLVGQYFALGEAKGIAVSGRYACLGHGGGGLQTLDVSSPEAPVFIGSYQTEGDARGVDVSGRLVYLADGAGGLKIFDLSDPAYPALIGQFIARDNFDIIGLQSANDVSVQGTTAYVAYDFIGLKVVDVSDPAHPRLLRSFNEPGWAQEFCARGPLGYLIHCGRGLFVYDISIPDATRQIGSLALSGEPAGLYVHGRYVYVAATQYFHIVSVVTPSSPKLVATFQTPGQAYKVCVDGRYAFIADGPAGIQILDILDPINPR
jgi:DNA-binding CsgD family transcriptional regulator